MRSGSKFLYNAFTIGYLLEEENAKCKSKIKHKTRRVDRNLQWVLLQKVWGRSFWPPDAQESGNGSPALENFVGNWRLGVKQLPEAEDLGMEFLALENFVLFGKNNLILGLF